MMSALDNATCRNSVAFDVTIVPAGRLGDIMGRRSLFLIGLAMFDEFGGLAWSATAVIWARWYRGWERPSPTRNTLADPRPVSKWMEEDRSRRKIAEIPESAC
jgi:MFS family permease